MNFQEARIRAGFTQESLAREMRVSLSTLAKWERGAHSPGVSILPKLQEVLGLSESEVMDIVRNLQTKESA